MARADRKRILVLGGTGMLGHMLVTQLSKQFDVWTTVRRDWDTISDLGLHDRSRVFDRVEVSNVSTIEQAVSDTGPDFVINCIGIVKQSRESADPIKSIAINALFPHQLASVCHRQGTKVIHISTDCVFSGITGNYTEESLSDAQDLYGQTKALGELTEYEGLTLRTSIIGPELLEGPGLFDWFMQQRGSVSGYTNAVFSGLTTIELARVIALVANENPSLSGLYHVASEPISKYQLLSQIRTTFGLSTKIVPVSDPWVDRSLDGSKFFQATGYLAPSWPDMIAELYHHTTLKNGLDHYELAR